jgi:hypothetical protein
MTSSARIIDVCTTLAVPGACDSMNNGGKPTKTQSQYNYQADGTPRQTIGSNGLVKSIHEAQHIHDTLDHKNKSTRRQFSTCPVS